MHLQLQVFYTTFLQYRQQGVLDYTMQIKDFRVIFLLSLNMGEVKLFTWVDVLRIETFHLTETLDM